jgi:hypothetical protein
MCTASELNRKCKTFGVVTPGAETFMKLLENDGQPLSKNLGQF